MRMPNLVFSFFSLSEREEDYMHAYAKAMNKHEFIHGVRVKVFRWNEKLPEKLITESQGILMFRVHDKVEVLKDPTCDQILAAGYGTKGDIQPPLHTLLTFHGFCHKSCTEERFLKAISFIDHLFDPNNHKQLARLAAEYLLSCFSFDTLTMLDPTSPKLVLVMEVFRKVVVVVDTNTSLEALNINESRQSEERIKETRSVGMKHREEETRGLDQSSDEEEETCSNNEVCDILEILRYCLELSPTQQHPTKKQVSRLSEVEAVIKILTLVNGKIEDGCAICLEEFRRGGYPQIAKLPCSHMFHAHCAFKWLPNHGSCPMCRSVIFINKDG